MTNLRDTPATNSTAPAPASPIRHSDFELRHSVISLPSGQLTLLIGDPGTGKSLLSLDLAARISQGRAMPPTPCVPSCPSASVPAPVLIYSAEDSRDTILERLRAADAALEDFNIITSSAQLVPPLPQFADDVPDSSDSKIDHLLRVLDAMVAHFGSPALLIIDPLPALLGSHDSYRAASLRNPPLRHNSHLLT